MYFFIFFIIGISVVASKCPDVEIYPNIDVDLISGEWKEYYKYPVPWTDNWRCTSINIDSNMKKFKMIGIQNDEPVEHMAALEFDNIENDGIMNVISEDFKLSGDDSLKCKILSVDYDEYIIFYVCNEEHDTTNEMVWCLVRPDVIDSDKRIKVEEIFNSTTPLDHNKFKATDLSSEICPKFI